MTSLASLDQNSLLIHLEKNLLDLVKLFIQEPEIKNNNLDQETRQQIIRSLTKRLGRMKSIRRLPSCCNLHQH